MKKPVLLAFLILAAMGLPAWAQAPPVPTEIQEALKRLRDPDAKVRAKAAWLLGDQGKDALPVIDELIAAFADPKLGVRASLADAFGQMGPNAKKAVPILLTGLKDEDPRVRRHVVNALGLIKSEARIVVPALIQSLSDPDWGKEQNVSYVPKRAAFALGNFGAEAKPAVPILLKILHDPNVEWRFLVISPLGKIGDPQAVPHLLKYMNDKTDIFLRGRIASSLANFGPRAKDAIPHLIAIVKTQAEDQRTYSAKSAALRALGKMGSEATRESIDVLVEALRDKKGRSDPRTHAARSLGELGPTVARGAIPALVETLVGGSGPTNELIDSLAAMGKDAIPRLIPFVILENQKNIRVPDTVRTNILLIFEKMGPRAKEAVPIIEALTSQRSPIGPAAERALASILGLREPEKK